MYYISTFNSKKARFHLEQEKILHWLTEAHTKVEMDRKGWKQCDLQCMEFRSFLEKKFQQLGTGKDKIQNRRTEVSDFTHLDWERMELYPLPKNLDESTVKKRLEFLDQVVTSVFDYFYPLPCPLPNDIIHVSCTGYVSPSGGQKIVSKSGSNDTYVTHAYHMGCYGAIPALRIATGFNSLKGKKAVTDIVHTELCSLHLNPFAHDIGHLVAQTLFADGFIKYSVGTESQGFRLLSVHEEIIPESTSAMYWAGGDWGMNFILTKEVLTLIASHLIPFLKRIAEQSNVTFETLKKEAIFAIHPGGAKIVLQIAKFLELEDWQLSHTFHIMKNFGNMSSATVPHIWQKIDEDPDVKSKTKVVTLAFGPGLNACGAVLEKV